MFYHEEWGLSQTGVGLGNNWVACGIQLHRLELGNVTDIHAIFFIISGICCEISGSLDKFLGH